MKQFNLLSAVTILICLLSFSCKDESYSIPKKGLVAYYTFKNSTAKDLSKNGNDGVLTGVTSTADRFNKSSSAFFFDSSDDAIEVTSPSFLNNDQGTFCAWVKFADVNATQYLASVGDVDTQVNYISFVRLDGTTHKVGVYQREEGLGNWVTGNTVIETNQFYHFVLVCNGSEWALYVNGVKEELTIVGGSNSGKWIKDLPGIDNFILGSLKIQEPYTIPFLRGTLDDVLLYDRPLSESEILSIYNNTRP